MQYLLIEDMEDFNDYIEKLSKLDKEKDLTIIINSEWWNTSIRDFLYNELKDFTYTLQVYRAISAWFDLFFRLKDKAKDIFIYDNTIFTIHLEGWRTIIWNEWVPRWDFANYQLEIQKSLDIKRYDCLILEQETKYLNWEDVYITPKQIKEYLVQKWISV